MRNYISSHLDTFYIVELAENGKEALDKLLIFKPNLVISDLMMPVMDGMELLQHLRKDQSYSDLPFIMLTARADEEDRISGFKARADEYMLKPFNPEELLVRVSNLCKTVKC